MAAEQISAFGGAVEAADDVHQGAFARAAGSGYGHVLAGLDHEIDASQGLDGYVAAGLWSGVWFSFFIGWFIKRSVLRYGGGALFHQATPVFVGLVAGQFFMGVVWFVVGLIHGEVSFAAV